MVRYGKVLFRTSKIEVPAVKSLHWATFFVHYIVRQRNDGWYSVHRIKFITHDRQYIDKRGKSFASLDFAKRYARMLYKRVERREDQ